jgi:hypothetical protein
MTTVVSNVEVDGAAGCGTGCSGAESGRDVYLRETLTGETNGWGVDEP